ncbi:MAG: hypothetical protein ABDH21_04445 [bacterium]
MEFEQTKFLAEYYFVYAITIVYISIIIYYVVYFVYYSIKKMARNKNVLLINILGISLKITQPQLATSFITATVMFLTIFVIIPTLSKHVQNKIEKKYSHIINERIFKSGFRFENLEVDKYIPSNANFFTYFLQNQNLSVYRIEIVEKNSFVINYLKSNKEYKIYLSEIQIFEVKKSSSIRSYRIHYEELFSGLCIGIPNEVFNTRKINNFSVYNYYITSDYSIVLVNFSESPFIFPLFEKISDELIQKKLREISKLVNNYLM